MHFQLLQSKSYFLLLALHRPKASLSKGRRTERKTENLSFISDQVSIELPRRSVKLPEKLVSTKGSKGRGLARKGGEAF